MNTAYCPGDGTTDVTLYLQMSIDNTPLGGTLCIPIPSISYLISNLLIISKPITIIGYQSTIIQSSVSSGVFDIKSSNVTIDGLILKGSQYTTQYGTSKAINCFGFAAAVPYTDINIFNCVIDSWGMWGIYYQYVSGFTIQNCKVRNINYGAIGCNSVKNGYVLKNYISNVIATPNAYGIIMSRITTSVNELVANPRSDNILIQGNYVENVLHWEGIDTHGGSRIKIDDNTVFGCNRGIVVCDCPNHLAVATYGPKDCIVSDNVVNSGVTDGSAVFGIVVSGCSSAVGTLTDPAEGCIVSGNTVRGYGNQAVISTPGMALYFLSTRGLNVVGNTVIEPSRVGMGFYYNNYGFTASNNVIQDPWNNTQQAVAISIVSDWNRGFIGGNSFVRGSKVAAHVLEVGLNVFGGVGNSANNSIFVTKNYTELAVPYPALYDPGSKTH